MNSHNSKFAYPQQQQFKILEYKNLTKPLVTSKHYQTAGSNLFHVNLSTPFMKENKKISSDEVVLWGISKTCQNIGYHIAA